MEPVNVISRQGLMRYARRLDIDIREQLVAWFNVARRAEWKALEDVRMQFPSADRVGQVLIFNVRGNAYRLIVRHEFPWNRLFVKAVLTHKEYDRKEWLRWS